MRGDLITLYIYLKGGSCEVSVGLFSQLTSDGTRGDGPELHQKRFRWAFRRNFFTVMDVRHWKRCPREMVVLLSLEVFKSHVDVELEDVA